MTIPKKMRRAAMRAALSAKAADGEMLAVNGITLDEISTRRMADFFHSLGVAGARVLLIADSVDEALVKSTRNIPYVVVRLAPNVSVRDVIDCDKIVVIQAALGKLEEVYSK